MKTSSRLAFSVLLAILLMACSAVPYLSSRLAPAPTSSPTLPDAALPTATTALGPSRVSGYNPPAAPQVLPTAWDDRSPFKANLTSSAQSILSGLPGASVYHIDVTIDPSLTALSGKEEVLYTNRETAALDQIHFRLFPNILGGEMTVSAVWVNNQPVQPALAQQGSDLVVPLAAPLHPGEQVAIRLAFADQVPPSHANSYDTFVYSQDILSLAQFYPLIPAYDAAGWHTEIPPAYGDVTYTDTSFYLVRISAPAGLVIAATGATLDQAKNGGDQTITLAAGPVRDFYIQASPSYAVSNERVGETTVNTYVPSGDQAAAASTLETAKSAFASFEKRFGPYPYTVFNISASPTQALGVEYPEEVALAMGLYHSGGQMLEGTLAHEAAHQWWYGIVGDDQVNQPWLDEAMAQYATYLYYVDTYSAAAGQAYRQDWENRWARVGNQPIPIGQPVSAYTGESYSAIVYGRGPLFIEALAKQMGDAKFAAFLKDYYAAYRFGITTTHDYEATAEKACNCDLHPLFQEWVNP